VLAGDGIGPEVTDAARRVLDAAVSVFAERGFHDASMDEIADHAGVSKPVLYTHFESKDGLYAATLRRAGQLLTERVRASAAPDLSAEQRMWAGIVAFVDVVSEHREWWIVARKAAMGEGEFADLGRQMHDEMAELLRGLFVETAAQRGIVGGAVLTFVTVASELSATVILYSGKWSTMTIVMFQALEGTSAGVAAAAAAVLILFTILPVALVYRVLRRYELSML